MKRVGYLVADPTCLSPEEAAAWKFLLPNGQVKNTLLPFDRISFAPAALKGLSALWWHYDTSTTLPPAVLDPSIATGLRNYIRRGGSLFLSLLAAQYAADLGVEEVRPNAIEKGKWNRRCWAEKYPDIRGLSSFRGHPIFNELHGAAYLWNPRPESAFAGAWYAAPSTPKGGRVIAVEREYIKLNEDWRIAVEYTLGRGRILTVGSFMFFADAENRFRPHLERFTLNCLEYLTQHRTEGNPKGKSFWNFEPRTVHFRQRKASEPIRSLSTPRKPNPSGLSLHREQATDNFFDVGGRRILIMGSETSGIEEVWVHPLRILKDVRIAFRIGSGELIPTSTLRSHITVRPESIARTFNLDGATIEETTFADTKRPAGAVYFAAGRHEPVEVMLTANIDLRTMWPLSHTATGSLVYSWDDGVQAVLVSAQELQATAILGCSLQPSEYIVGRYSGVKEMGGRFAGVPTDAVQVAIGLRYVMDVGTPGCTLVFAGSSVSEREATAAYRRMVSSPLARVNEHARYFKSLLSSLPQPDVGNGVPGALDPELKDAFLWAVAATDRFYVETPGIGTSLMAGYATTRSGWDGGQAISGRPGYAWYFGRDSVWTALAMLAYGDHAKARNVLELLGNFQDITGKIAHEITTSGHVHYDAADATPLYIVLMGRYLRTSGDLKFVRREFQRLLNAVDFCFSTDTDGDHLIENTDVGHGWIEGGPLFPAHAEIYLNACWAAALVEASFVADALKWKESRTWRRESKRVRRILNEDFWNPATGCFNFARNADGTFNTAITILPTAAMYFGLIDTKKAQRSLQGYMSGRFSTDWGVRLISCDDPKYSPTAYHYGSIWPLFTGWTALAALRHGLKGEGLKQLTDSLLLYKKFSLGYLPEVLHGERCEPAGVCQHQAWSEGLAVLSMLEAQRHLTPSRKILHHKRKKRPR